MAPGTESRSFSSPRELRYLLRQKKAQKPSTRHHSARYTYLPTIEASHLKKRLLQCAQTKILDFWQLYRSSTGYVHVNVFPGLGAAPLFTLSDKTVGFFFRESARCKQKVTLWLVQTSIIQNFKNLYFFRIWNMMYIIVQQ